MRRALERGIVRRYDTGSARKEERMGMDDTPATATTS